jgi:hypothetical protein
VGDSRLLLAVGHASNSANHDSITRKLRKPCQLGNGLLLQPTNLLYRTRFTDLCYGYCAFRRNVLGRLQLTATGFEVEAQLIMRACLAGLAITEVPSHESTPAGMDSPTFARSGTGSECSRCC